MRPTMPIPFSHCQGANDVEKVLESFVGEIGLPYFSYLLLRRPYESSTVLETTLLTNYPNEWQDRYSSRRYHMQDPVSDISAQSRLPFTWGSDQFLRNFRKSQRAVFHESRAFGIKHGYSIPISGPEGDLGVLSISGPNENDLREVVRNFGPTLQLHAVVAHDQLMNYLCHSEKANVRLSPRERECLLWTSEGKTSDEIAAILSISVSTVNYHLSNTIAKLNASNKLHAAIIAIRLNLL